MTRLKQGPDHRLISGLMVFLLLALFALFCTMLIMMGAQAYRGVVDAAETNANKRILLNYPINKVRMNDDAAHIRVEDIDGTPVLVLEQDLDGDIYLTRVYCYDGALSETFMYEEDEFALEDGEPLARAESFTPKVEDGLFSFDVVAPDGSVLSGRWALRSKA